MPDDAPTAVEQGTPAFDDLDRVPEFVRYFARGWLRDEDEVQEAIRLTLEHIRSDPDRVPGNVLDPVPFMRYVHRVALRQARLLVRERHAGAPEPEFIELDLRDPLAMPLKESTSATDDPQVVTEQPRLRGTERLAQRSGEELMRGGRRRGFRSSTPERLEAARDRVLARRAELRQRNAHDREEHAAG